MSSTSKHVRSITGAAAMSALLAAGLFSGALAQQPPSSDQYMAAFTASDSNADRHLTDEEIEKYEKGDADKDGRITNAEFMKACEDGVFEAMSTSR